MAPTGGAIFRLIPDGCHKSIRVLASYNVLQLPPIVGEVLTLSGSYVNDRRYGRQFVASAAVRSLPRDRSVTRLFVSHPTFAWLGADVAQVLWKSLDAQLFEALGAGDHAVLAKCARLAPSEAIRLIRDWRNYSREINVSECFARQGLPLSAVSLAIELWGNDTTAHVTANPYELVPISTWRKIDDTCMNLLSFDAADSRRLIAACIACAYDYTRRNRTHGIPLRTLTRLIRVRLGDPSLAGQATQLAQALGYISVSPGGAQATVKPAGLRILEEAFVRRVGILEVAANSITSVNNIRSSATTLRSRSRPNISSGFSVVDVGSQTMFNVCIGVIDQAMHIFPSISMRAQPLPIGHQSALFSELLDPGYKHNEEISHYVIYGTNALDIVLATKLIHSLPAVANISMLCVLGCEMPADAFPAFLMDACGAIPLKFADWNKIYGAAGGELKADAPNAPSVMDTAKCEFESHADGCKKALMTRTTFSSSVDAQKSALTSYRLGLNSGTALLLTFSTRDAGGFNRILHDENLELRRAMGLATPTVRIHSRGEATIDDHIVARRDIFSKGILAGSTGKVTSVSYYPAIGNVVHGQENSVVATAFFDTVGSVELTAMDCQEIDLGYALPIELDRWGIVAHRIVLISAASAKRSECMVQNIYRTTKSFQIIDAGDVSSRPTSLQKYQKEREE